MKSYPPKNKSPTLGRLPGILSWTNCSQGCSCLDKAGNWGQIMCFSSQVQPLPLSLGLRGTLSAARWDWSTWVCQSAHTLPPARWPMAHPQLHASPIGSVCSLLHCGHSWGHLGAVGPLCCGQCIGAYWLQRLEPHRTWVGALWCRPGISDLLAPGAGLEVTHPWHKQHRHMPVPHQHSNIAFCCALWQHQLLWGWSSVAPGGNPGCRCLLLGSQSTQFPYL